MQSWTTTRGRCDATSGDAMTLPTRAEAIERILKARTHPDLAASYGPHMECQVIVGRDGGKPVEGFRGRGGQTWTDGAARWGPFRIPKGSASDDPEDNSGLPMSFDSEHVEGIGMTGWDFVARRSRWVAYDFDAIVGHSERHVKKLTDAELEAVSAAAQGIPWVSVRKSASGSGLHLYVHLDPAVPTKNHNEHAALARAILSTMSARAGHDFCASVDVNGGNMWVWHRKMRGTKGLELVKRGVPLSEVPPDWRSHVKVVSGFRKKALPSFVADGLDAQPDLDATFDELAGQHPRTKLDDDHKKLIRWLEENGGCGWWDADHHMLVTHTVHLKRAHEALNLKGHFETTSPGTEPGEQNCFCFVLRRGAWAIRRYSPGAAEHESWEQDGKGFTRCTFNRDPDLRSASRAKGGVESEQGGFMFREAEIAAQVARSLGSTLEVDPLMATRPARLKPHKDGKRVIIEMDHQAHDQPKNMEGWYVDKGRWKRVVGAPLAASAEVEAGTVDDVVRHATTESRMDAGWFVRVDSGWNHEPKAHVQLSLLSLGRKKAEVDSLMGASVLKPWTICNRPFDDEYPGDRLWNKSTAKYRYPKVDDPGPTPHWEMILEHCGKALDEYVAQNPWAAANGIVKGADYLRLWLACVLQHPYEPLPYLFMWGSQNCGKSIFHEAVDLLISGGMVQTNPIFEKDEKFNSLLEGAVLCVIEEMDLNANKKAYERIKIWVTSPNITIRKMYLNPYELRNTTHWVHTANSPNACPIFPGDTRITVVHVGDLTSEEKIPKPEFRERLKREAPHFLSQLLNIEVPPSGDRLRIPVITSADKEALAQSNRTSLEEFIELFVHEVHGEIMNFAEFHEKFVEWLSPHEAHQWPKAKVSKGLPPHFPMGTRGGQGSIGNMSWTPRTDGQAVKPRLILQGRLLVPAATK